MGIEWSDLSDEEQRRVRSLAQVRRESELAVLSRFPDLRAVRRIPKSITGHSAGPIGVEFSEAGMRDGLPFVRLPNGRVFYGHPSNENHRRVYRCISDRVSPCLSEDTFLLAMDVTSRYLTNWAWYPSSVLPERGGSIVEVGAYLGHKTLRFHDEVVGPEGTIMAIEAVPDNSDILQKNIVDNGCGDSIHSCAAAAWNETGTMEISGMGYQRNSLVSVDHLKQKCRFTVRTDTLDNLLEDFPTEVIDFLDIRVNGAEVEVLDGLSRQLPRVRVLFVAALYQRDGEQTYDRCKSILQSRGCLIRPETTRTAIYASPKRFGTK